jgi:sigma54-dependent transcription regulator
MKTNKIPSNPRMSNPDGVYASEARLEDCVTLRDEIAMRALQGHLASEYYAGMNSNKENLLGIARTMYLFADAMLEVREETK